LSRFLSSDYIKLLVAYVIWWLTWISIQTIVLNKLGFSFNVSLIDAVVSQVMLSFSGYAINTSLRFYKPQRMVKFVFSWSVGMAAVSTLAQQMLLKNIFAADTSYLFFLKQSLITRGAFNCLMVAFITMISWLWFNTVEQHENDKQRENAERLAREAELSSLRTQLQPHFLFNSLNSISALIVSSPEQARTMIQQLSDFLRGTVRKDDRQLVTLDEEMLHLQLYLEIEKIRFGHRLRTEIQSDEESRRAMLPSLLLQPIVENAIKFGLYDTIGEITITIAARLEKQILHIEIRNPFDITTAQPRQGTGFGLNSIRRRLYLIYSQNDLLETENDGIVFTTLIKIPQLP
jgi:two-component system, LytTR family, sensor kinase